MKNIRLEVYSDSDWASDPSDRKSVSGCIVLINGTPSGWWSIKQGLVTLSSSEAELVALVESVKHTKYLKQLVEAFGENIDNPVEIRCDNQAAIRIAAKGVIKRTKHLDIRDFYIKDEIDSNEVHVTYVDTANNIADMFTKPLDRRILEYLCDKLYAT